MCQNLVYYPQFQCLFQQEYNVEYGLGHLIFWQWRCLMYDCFNKNVMASQSFIVWQSNFNNSCIFIPQYQHNCSPVCWKSTCDPRMPVASLSHFQTEPFFLRTTISVKQYWTLLKHLLVTLRTTMSAIDEHCYKKERRLLTQVFGPEKNDSFAYKKLVLVCRVWELTMLCWVKCFLVCVEALKMYDRHLKSKNFIN